MIDSSIAATRAEREPRRSSCRHSEANICTIHCAASQNCDLSVHFKSLPYLAFLSFPLLVPTQTQFQKRPLSLLHRVSASSHANTSFTRKARLGPSLTIQSWCIKYVDARGSVWLVKPNSSRPHRRTIVTRHDAATAPKYRVSGPA